MKSCLIEFDELPWIAPDNGIRYKAFVSGNQRVRLVEFSDGFVEADWCRHGHAGYVIDGEFALDCSGETERYCKGDVFFIPKGEESKHKAVLGKGEKVTLLLFETIE
jgi:Uncharacterized conserved protein, contains double-stranded beta-helix domain